MKTWKDSHSARNSPLSFPEALKAIALATQFWRGRRTSTPHSTFSRAHLNFSHPAFVNRFNHLVPLPHRPHRRRLPLSMTPLIVESLLYPSFPLNPDTHVPHPPFMGTTRSSSASTARRACSSSIDWFAYTSSRRLTTPQIISWRAPPQTSLRYSQATLRDTRAS
jgi:hypothetical protein